jgi:hypothetical protein
MASKRWEIRWTNSRGRITGTDTYHDLDEAKAAEREGRFAEPRAIGWTVRSSRNGESEMVGLHP